MQALFSPLEFRLYLALDHMDYHFCLSDSARPGKKGFFPGSHMIKEVIGERAIGSMARKEFRVSTWSVCISPVKHYRVVET